MAERKRTYIAIDLKSFYASVECVDRGLDPLNTNLVVADTSRTQKTICLAVSPSLKAYGIPGRARLFEVVEKVRQVNERRKVMAPGKQFTGESYIASELKEHPELELSYIAAVPRMGHYIKYSARIFDIYLKYVAPEDMHVYSVDEVFMDVTEYLQVYGMTPYELTRKIIYDVLNETGITATAGIGTNMYLCKIAMDIEAKHTEADENGVRIAYLDEYTYRKKLWNHTPITDFWRVGRGYAKRLKEHGMYTMGDVARCSIGSERDYHNEDLLYKMFGVNAELLIDHAWGYEPCTIAQVRAYKPENNSFSSGQVLQSAYDFKKARVVTHEMADTVALNLVDKHMVTDQLVLTVGYDIESLTNPEIRRKYKGPVTTDHYGRRVPKSAHGSINLTEYSSSSKEIIRAVLELY
ncbi:MAG: DNA methylase, partial [Lachnospiraceae bacterium]|nr:DNA methylase [Lachnospiraceae bacterium]